MINQSKDFFYSITNDYIFLSKKFYRNLIKHKVRQRKPGYFQIKLCLFFITFFLAPTETLHSEKISISGLNLRDESLTLKNFSATPEKATFFFQSTELQTDKTGSSYRSFSITPWIDDASLNKALAQCSNCLIEVATRTSPGGIYRKIFIRKNNNEAGDKKIQTPFLVITLNGRLNDSVLTNYKFNYTEDSSGEERYRAVLLNKKDSSDLLALKQGKNSFYEFPHSSLVATGSYKKKDKNATLWTLYLFNFTMGTDQYSSEKMSSDDKNKFNDKNKSDTVNLMPKRKKLSSSEETAFHLGNENMFHADWVLYTLE